VSRLLSITRKNNFGGRPLFSTEEELTRNDSSWQGESGDMVARSTPLPVSLLFFFFDLCCAADKKSRNYAIAETISSLSCVPNLCSTGKAGSSLIFREDSRTRFGMDRPFPPPPFLPLIYFLCLGVHWKISVGALYTTSIRRADHNRFPLLFFSFFSPSRTSAATLSSLIFPSLMNPPNEKKKNFFFLPLRLVLSLI